MPDWRGLFCFWSKRRAAAPLRGETPQPTPAADSLKSNAGLGTLPSTNKVDQQPSSFHRPTPGTPNTTYETSTTVANGFKLSLRLLKEAVTGIGVPGLESAVSGVVKVIDIIDNVRGNDQDLSSLNHRISNIAGAINKSSKLHSEHEAPEALRSTMEAFLRELQVLLDEVEGILSDRNLASRTANSEANRGSISKINTRIDQLIGQFSVEGIISLEVNVAGARQDVRAVSRKVDDVDQKVDEVKEAQLAQDYKALMLKYEALIEKIPRVHARYNDTSTRPSRACHRGTRSDLLQGINKWIVGGADDTPYLWLCGEVGVGKTTVAHTIAEEQERLKQLGASYFFSRHESARQAPHMLFPSLAYQLARFDRGIWTTLAEVLTPDPDIVNRSLTEQFTKLILEPLSRSGMAPSRTVVIVIDGLDECADPASVLDALALGVEYVSVRLRVLVCSRPYAAIQSKFKNTPLYHLASQTHFHNINPETLSNDVAAFLTWSLTEIAARPANRNLSSPWPAEDQLAELISRADGLFIVASTYTKYIDDPIEDNPAGQLTRILSRKRGIGSSPLAELDALYDQVLDDLRRSLKTADELVTARSIVETVILARSEMSLIACGGLLAIEPSDVRSVLRRLPAVILLPEVEDEAITPFHTSFGEYIQDNARCTIQELSVETTSAHSRIAARCIAAITSVTRNDIIGMEYTVTIAPHLQYASANLAAHVSASSHGQENGSGQLDIQGGIWAWLNLLFVQPTTLRGMVAHVERASFERLLLIEGQDAGGGIDASIATRMLADHTAAINHSSGISIQLPTPAAESVRVDLRLPKETQLFRFDYSEVDDNATVLENTLEIVAEAWRWNMHTYPNMFVQNVTVDLSSPREVRLLVLSSASLREICSLSEYLGKIVHLDVKARCHLALEVAKNVCHLHEASPLHAHGRLVPDLILLAEGKPMFAPRTWHVAKSPKDSIEHHSFDCQMSHSSDWNPEDYWFCPDRVGYLSPQARQLEDIWDFGSILFQIITTTQPLPRYKQLAEGQVALGYDQDTNDIPGWYWRGSLGDDIYQARFDTAVALLLSKIEGYDEFKPVMKACWTFKPRDRPSMRIVVEQLEAILQTARNVL